MRGIGETRKVSEQPPAPFQEILSRKSLRLWGPGPATGLQTEGPYDPEVSDVSGFDTALGADVLGAAGSVVWFK